MDKIIEKKPKDTANDTKEVNNLDATFNSYYLVNELAIRLAKFQHSVFAEIFNPEAGYFHQDGSFTIVPHNYLQAKQMIANKGDYDKLPDRVKQHLFSVAAGIFKDFMELTLEHSLYPHQVNFATERPPKIAEERSSSDDQQKTQ